MVATTRFGGILVAGVLVATSLAPVANAAEPRAIGWILTRTKAAATPIEGRLDAFGVSEESAVTMFALVGSRSQRRLDYRFVTTTAEWGVDGWAQVNDDRVPAVPCPAACDNPVGMPQGIYVTSNDRALVSTVYIAAYDVRDPKLDITSPGWTVRRWEPGWRSLTLATSDGSSVSALHYGIGTYRGGQLPGGSYGSFVSAAVPCGSRGDGKAVLTGGTRRLDLACDGYHTAVDGIPKRTTWRVAGEVTGDGWTTNVLIVVDYPRG